MKRLRMSTRLLPPHGFAGGAGAGAAFERLQLCADDNMQVVNAQRRRITSMRCAAAAAQSATPVGDDAEIGCATNAVSNLRIARPRSTAPCDAESKPGSTITLKPNDQIKTRIRFRKGYYDLPEEQKRGETASSSCGWQIYPFAGLALTDELTRFPNAELIWCQEEPKNQGAWSFVAPNIESLLEQLGLKGPLRYAGRKASASPAAGQASQHQAELQSFLNDALTLTEA
jgi:2-oxoglutarate dehydrogenase E1 component